MAIVCRRRDDGGREGPISGVRHSSTYHHCMTTSSLSGGAGPLSAVKLSLVASVPSESASSPSPPASRPRPSGGSVGPAVAGPPDSSYIRVHRRWSRRQ
eukprot:4908562-Pleurochrysis_carterae.AAC.1